MQYKNLGKTGLKVSELSLGTLTYGDQVEENDAIKIIQTALDSGVNFIDTANVYTGGKSEEAVGKAIKDRRDSVVLATKVGTRAGGGEQIQTDVTDRIDSVVVLVHGSVEVAPVLVLLPSVGPKLFL